MDIAAMDVPTAQGLNPNTRGPQIDDIMSQLAALFQRTEADLKYVSRKLQSEFSEAYAAVGAQTLNPSKAVARLNSIREEMANLVARNNSVEQQKKAIVSQLNCHAQDGLQTIRMLEAHCLIQSEENMDDEQTLALVNCQSDSNITIKNRVASNMTEISEIPPHQRSANRSSTTISERSTKNFIPVSAEELCTISDLVKGRVKLADVNHVYKTLHAYYRKPGTNNKNLTTKDMVQMGLKVTGQSGEAKLKILRQLGLITLNNRDNSVQLKFPQ